MKIDKCGLEQVTVKNLKAKKINTVEDYMTILPVACKEYLSYSQLQNNIGNNVLLHARVNQYKEKKGKPTLIIVYMTEIATGIEFTASWFGQIHRKYDVERCLGKCVALTGVVLYNTTYGYQVSSPEIFIEDTAFKFGVYPKYRKIKGISDEMQRKMHMSLRLYMTENLEFPVLEYAGLMDRRTLYTKIHFPKSLDEYNMALEEIRYRDLLYFSINMKSTYAKSGKCCRLIDKNNASDDFLKLFSYILTNGQQEAINAIKRGFESGNRLRLLIQGDVGCGKTVTALYAAIYVAGSGKQALLVAPTSVLAVQHYNEIKNYVEKLNNINHNLKVEFLCGSMTAKEKREAHARIKNGESNIIVGTHSTFVEKCEYNNLAVIIVDEEHRFGVSQREQLKNKAENGSHIISMSATPIPRSMCEILYGDGCEVIAIKELPSGRKPIQSARCKNDISIFKFVEKQVSSGRQCYVVCPHVTANEDYECQSVEETDNKYSEYFNPLGYKVASVHGKMTKREMDETIEKFKKNEIQILIATTVIEVGVNVPNANVIVIENAEMFGLATLHQLRGRVGRGIYDSYCIFKSIHSDNPRINLLLETTDGFKIAEEDIKLRGTGNLIGIEQTGFNQYIDLITKYPEEYKKASNTAMWMIKKGYTNYITEITKEI